jgi:hypothetical protein
MQMTSWSRTSTASEIVLDNDDFVLVCRNPQSQVYDVT